MTDKAYIGEGTALALRKQDQELATKFNQAIETIRANGTYDKIAAKYFSFDIYGETCKSASMSQGEGRLNLHPSRIELNSKS